MKLALVTPNYAPLFEGGTERVVRAQAAAFGELGHEVKVVSGTHVPHDGRDRIENEVDGTPVVHLPARADEPFDIALTRPRLVEACAAETADADLVHVHHWMGFGMDLVRALATGGRPVAVTYHDLFATCTRSFRTPIAGVTCPERGDADPCVRCLAPDVPDGRGDEAIRSGVRERNEAFDHEARAASLLCAPSATHARHVESLLGLEANAVCVVPNGLCASVERVSRGEWPDWNGQRALRVVHLGHRTQAKGTRDLVEALCELPAGTVELHLLGTAVEEGFDEALEEAADDAGLLLHAHGAYAPEELAEIAKRLGGFDLCCLPSRARESYGLVLDEALALGLPVWVSDRGALHERVGGAGRVLPAENPQAWASAFRQVLDNPRVLAGERALVPEGLPTGADAARLLVRHYERLLAK